MIIMLKKNKIFTLPLIEIYHESSYVMQKRAYALAVFLAIIFIILPLAIFLLYSNEEHAQTFELFFTLILIEVSIVTSVILLYKGKYNAAANLIVLSLLLSLLVVLAMTIVKYIYLGDMFYLQRLIYFRYTYPAIIVIAMMFCENRWILITSIILVLATIVSYFILKYEYNVTADIYTISVIFSFSSFIVIAIISILSRKITDGAHARLEDIINNLEAMVQSRTKDLKAALHEKETINVALNAKTIELEKLKKRAEIQARTDVLTGLHNRLSFMEYSIKEMQRTIRYKHPLSIILSDIDHFKVINDTYGHAEGDKALKAVATIIIQNLRNNDFPARIGGEEFAILLPETNLKSAMPIAERIRAVLEESVKVENKSVTCSFGIATLHDDDTSIDSLLSRADAALYVAKNNGRNRVEIEIID